jgi:hypothetical protein
MVQKLSELPIEDRKIVDELNKSSKKLTVLLLLPRCKGKSRAAIVFCDSHPGEVFCKRVDNIRTNPAGGCIRCGRKSLADQPDRDFVRDRLPEPIRKKVIKILIDDTKPPKRGDRTNLLVTVETKYFHVTARQKNINKVLQKVDGYAEEILKRHGDYVDFLISHSSGSITFEATCKIENRKSTTRATVMRDWRPRSKPEVRKKLYARIERSQVSPYDVFRTSGEESKPANLVRRLVAKFANGAKPDEEKTFVGLAGKKRLLRIDFYYRDLNLLVEVQSILHYKSVEHFGGDSAFDQRVEYDTTKVKYWESFLKEKGVMLKHIRGDAKQADVSNAVRQMVEEALLRPLRSNMT